MTLRIVVILQIFIACVLSACGGRPEEQASRERISTKTRQLNALLLDFQDKRESESRHKILREPDNHASYINSLKDLRLRLAADTLLTQFELARAGTDSLISCAIEFLILRQALLFGLSELSSTRSQFYEDQDSARSCEPDPRRRSQYTEYHSRVLDDFHRFNRKQAGLQITVPLMDSIAFRLVALGTRVNSESRRLNIPDTITFHATIRDTSDLLFVMWQDLAVFRFDPPD
jgi:hypothetical protein